MTAATAVLGYTLRACLPLRRWWLLALPCVGAVLFGLLARVSDDTPERAFAQVAAHGLFALLIPIACLVIGDAVLGAEIRAGTFHFTWLSPAPVRTIRKEAEDTIVPDAVALKFTAAPLTKEQVAELIQIPPR